MATTIAEQELRQKKEHLTRLVRQGRYDEARQYAHDMNHPKLDEVLEIIAEVEGHRQMIMTQEIEIPTVIKRPEKIVDDINKPLPADFPVHPKRVMRNRYGWGLGVWILAFGLGLRSFRLFQNYVKMEHTLYAVLYGIIYFWIVGLFIGSAVTFYNVVTTPPLNLAGIVMSLIGMAVLPLSPYAFAIVQEPVFKHWHEEFRRQRDHLDAE